MADPDADPDEDLLSVRASGGHLLDHLDSIEKQVITARFGLDGSGAHSMKEIQATTGLAREDLRRIMGSGLSKLRADLR
ncbi:MAG TPA: sigma factor-like helix-turn-helix DNA-binding protein [Acidimicrobiales bacterium]|nr:sigma factor-like helix-turn-helix DNA-binding protein [Acidimicrobiales bacterium]